MKSKNGFTLIEILVVITLIGIFTSVIISQIQKSRNAGNDVETASKVRLITGALETYKVENGKYPSTLTDTKFLAIQNIASLADITYVGFDLDGYSATCEAYAVSAPMKNSDARELKYDDDRIVGYSIGSGCSSVGTTCSQGSSGCFFGAPFKKGTDGEDKDWVFDLTNLPK